MKWKGGVFIHFAAYLAMLKFTGGISDDFCHKADGKGNSNCENIYIWKSDQENFISLLNVTFSQPEVNMLKALEGKTVRVVSHSMQPFVISHNKTERIGGYLGDIWTIVQESLKFKSDVLAIDYDTGLELISHARADVLLAAGVVKDGLLNVAYSQPYIYNWYNLYIKRPPARASATSYVKTLSQQLWYASLIMFCVLTIVLWLSTTLLNSVYSAEPKVSLPSCFLTICGGFLNQGYDLRVSSVSSRIQIIFALLLGSMLYIAVNAVLVAKLAVFEVELPFKSLQDIGVQQQHSLCLRTNSFVYNQFTDSNRTILPKWKNVLNAHECLDIMNQTNLAKIICKNDVVIFENRVVMATVLKEFRIPCDIANLEERYFPRGNSYMMTKSFFAKHAIEYIVLKMKTTGVLRRLEETWIRRKRIINDQQIEEPKATINHISGILALYGSAIIFSFMILLVEIIFNKYFVDRRPIPYTK